METEGSIQSKLRDYCALTKPEVNLLVLMTTSAGFGLASPGALDLARLINTLLGTLLVASGTATLNQWVERVWDGRMRRTERRPLPSGRLSARAAFWFGVLVSIAGGVYLELTVNRLAALLAISTLLSYLLIYTPLKRKTPLSTLIGAFPGAMPVLIGSAGASATLGRQAWLLFSIVFLWQFPHFLSIALMYRDDYARAGYKMLPAFDRDGNFTRSEIVILTIMLVIATVLPVIDSRSVIYFVGILMAGVPLLYQVGKLAKSKSSFLASRVLHSSIFHLPVVLALMIAAKH